MMGNASVWGSKAVLQAFLVTLLLGSWLPVHAGDEQEVRLKLPPQSLGRWYRPANKRQAWLHTMFGLRREMLAVSDYLALEDQPHAGKWVERLAKCQVPCDHIPRSRERLFLARELIDVFLSCEEAV